MRSIIFSEKANKAFEECKRLLSKATILVHQSNTAHVAVMDDASDKTQRTVLQQKGNDVWLPLSFFSRRLDATQQRSDHKPLIYTLSQKIQKQVQFQSI